MVVSNEKRVEVFVVGLVETTFGHALQLEVETTGWLARLRYLKWQ